MGLLRPWRRDPFLKKTESRLRRLSFEPLEERRVLATFTVTNLLDGPVAAAGDLPGSLRQAIFDANESDGADEIVFEGVSGTLLMTEGEFLVTETLSVLGPGRDVLAIDAQQQSRHLHVPQLDGPGDPRDLLVAGLTLQNGEDFAGGAVRFIGGETLTIQESRITGNRALDSGVQGGAVYTFGSSIVIRDSELTHNYSRGNGGAVDATFGKASIYGSVLRENSSFGGGGAVFSYRGVTIADSVIENNTAGGGGGGVRAFQGGTIERSRISGNEGEGEGGGILLQHQGTRRLLEIVDSEITDNKADVRGGGISVSGFGPGPPPEEEVLLLRRSEVSGNEIIGGFGRAGNKRGGGVHVFGSATILESDVNGNVGTIGGGIYSSGFTEVTDSQVTNNTGGGIASQEVGVMVTRSVVSGNATTDQRGGGGVLSLSGDVVVSDSTISGNSVAGLFGQEGPGGGVAARDGSVAVSQSTISGNWTNGQFAPGGGIYAARDQFSDEGGDVSITDSVVEGNRTEGIASQGGGISGLEVSIVDSVVRDNSTRGGGSGGGVHAVELELIRSRLTGNATLEANSPGGGAHVFGAGGDATIADSVVSGNSTSGYDSPGGGLSLEGVTVSIIGSTIRQNHTSGDRSGGGGVRSVDFRRTTLIETAVSDNQTSGVDSPGGGVWANDVTVVRSSIHGNRTAGERSPGGGLRLNELWAFNATISGNGTEGAVSEGGGVFATGVEIGLFHSTLVSNIASQSEGGGIRALAHVELHSTIVAENAAGLGANDISVSAPLMLTAADSILGELTPGTPALLDNTLVGVDPMLGPLGSHGGPTQTHPLLPGSPAINAGDPEFDPENTSGFPSSWFQVPFEFRTLSADQRGGLYARVVGGRIDIGAYEAQQQHADFDGDWDVDLFDLLAQQRGFGTPAPDAVKADGDADGDLDVDADDQSAALNALGAGSELANSAVAVLGEPAAQETPPPVEQPYFVEVEPATAVSGLVNALSYSGPNSGARVDAAVREEAVDAAFQTLGQMGPVVDSVGVMGADDLTEFSLVSEKSGDEPGEDAEGEWIVLEGLLDS